MLSQSEVICPEGLLKTAAQAPAIRTAIANAGTPIVMESVRDAVVAGFLEPVFFGEPAGIADCAAKLDWDISEFLIVSAKGETEAATAAALAAGRGEVSAIMKGHVHTDVFMRALLDREAGLRTGRRLTHLFHMTVRDKPGELFITDAALNVAPDLETKREIIQNVVDMAHAVGIAVPKIALLSATEVPTETIPSSIEAAELTDWAKDNIAGAHIFGPLAFDLAVSPTSVEIKGVAHSVAGRADALIVPDIVSGNALYKMMVHFMGACAAGIVLGAKVPILLTSRADPPAARLASAALAAIFQNREKHGNVRDATSGAIAL